MKKRQSLFFIIFLIAILTFALAGFDFSTPPENYVKANVLEVQGNTIILGHNCTALIAQTTPENAFSIILGKRKTIDVRPNAHDVFAQTLKTFNITLESVQINYVAEGWFHADAIFKAKDKVLKLDIKPSDGMALALRLDAPIYINQTLLNELGEKIC